MLILVSSICRRLPWRDQYHSKCAKDKEYILWVRFPKWKTMLSSNHDLEKNRWRQRFLESKKKEKQKESAWSKDKMFDWFFLNPVIHSLITVKKLRDGKTLYFFLHFSATLNIFIRFKSRFSNQVLAKKRIRGSVP